MPENKSCENCAYDCNPRPQFHTCPCWTEQKSAGPRGENYHADIILDWETELSGFFDATSIIHEKLTKIFISEIAAAEKRGVEKEREISKSLYLALSELQALVHGECPSLLNEDSGGDSKLDMEIADALKKFGEGK